MQKIKFGRKALAFVLSVALLLCCLPAMYAMADFTSENLLETKLDTENSYGILFNHREKSVSPSTGGGLASNGVVAGLVDGNTSANHDIWGMTTDYTYGAGYNWYGVQYKLTETSFASHITLYADYSGMEHYYDIYASNSDEDLYCGINLMGKVYCDGTAQTVNINKDVLYVAIVFDAITSGDTNARPKELQLWSGDEASAFTPVELTDASRGKYTSYYAAIMSPTTHVTSEYSSFNANSTNDGTVKKTQYITSNVTGGHEDFNPYPNGNYGILQFTFDDAYYIGDVVIDADLWTYDQDWAVYASNTSASLYSNDSLIVDDIHNRYGTGNRVTLNTYAKYVALVFKGYTRIRAIRIYTADSTGVEKPFVPENVLLTDTGMTATPFWQTKANGALSNGNYYAISDDNFAAYTDGDFATKIGMRPFNTTNYRVGGRYELSQSYYVGDIVLFAARDTFSEVYGVYVSDSSENLISEGNCVFASGTVVGSGTVIPVNGYVQYIAFLCESYTDSKPYFSEIEVLTADDSGIFIPENALRTKLSSVTGKLQYVSSGYTSDATIRDNGSDDLSVFTDGDTATHTDLKSAPNWEDSRRIGAQFVLTESTFIGTIKLYAAISETHWERYRIIASDSEEDLYSDESKILISNAYTDGSAPIEVTVNAKVQYIVFFCESCYSQPRFKEIEAWTADESAIPAPAEGPQFKTHNLILTDAIGVNFYMDLEALTAEEKAASYMTFDVSNGEGSTASFDSGFVNDSGYFGFACYVSSVQMAESVTPTFHYGSGETVVGEPYSVKDYIDYVKDNSGSFDATVVTLVKAIGDYGHYAQDYLGAKNGWTAGTDYTALAKYRAADYGSDDYADIKTALSDNGKVADHTGTSSGAAAGQYQFALNFDSTTSLVIKLANNTAATATSNYDGNVAGDALDGAYLFYLLKMPVSKLGNMYSVSGSIDGNDYSISISGLSYVYGVLNSGTTSDAAKKAVCSLYDYYTAATAYQATLS